MKFKVELIKVVKVTGTTGEFKEEDSAVNAFEFNSDSFDRDFRMAKIEMAKLLENK
jgi:tellurite resistance protein